MDYYFMSLGTNCAPILFLGPKRIKGPVDNVAITNVQAIKYLFNNTYYSYICNGDFQIETPLYKSREKDPLEGFIYNCVRIIHNNPCTEKYQRELKNRVLIFNDFLRNVRIKRNYFFTLCLNEAMVNTSTHTLKDNTFGDICKYLESERLLDKVIIVQTHADGIPHGGYCNCYINDINKGKKKYHLKVVDIYGTDINKPETLCEQFKEKIKEIL